LISRNRPAPFSERTDQKIPVVAGGYQMPAEIEQIADGSVSAQEPLRLTGLTVDRVRN